MSCDTVLEEAGGWDASFVTHLPSVRCHPLWWPYRQGGCCCPLLSVFLSRGAAQHEADVLTLHTARPLFFTAIVGLIAGGTCRVVAGQLCPSIAISVRLLYEPGNHNHEHRQPNWHVINKLRVTLPLLPTNVLGYNIVVS